MNMLIQDQEDPIVSSSQVFQSFQLLFDVESNEQNILKKLVEDVFDNADQEIPTEDVQIKIYELIDKILENSFKIQDV